MLNTNGEKVPIPEQDIDEITPSKLSSMPDGVLKELTLQEIADLFAYVTTDPSQTVAQRPAEVDRKKANREDTPPRR